MAGIADVGIGSGLNIKKLVNSTVKAEIAPKATQLNRLEKSAEAKFSALGTLQSALSNFQTAMKDLNNMDLFNNRTANSSNTALLTASSEKTALSGTYRVQVEQLASSSKVSTAALAKDFSSDSDGALTVKLGANDTDAVTINIAKGANLVEIRDALNEQLKDKGISANIVNNPATGQSQLIFSGKETGAGNDIIIEGTGGVVGLSVDGTVKAAVGGAGYLEQAGNAKFTIDGLQLESASNTVTNAIPDVSFTLKGTTEANKPLTVTVGQDDKGVKEQLKKFVDSYNEFVKVSGQLTAVTKVGDAAPVVGSLVGDSTVRNLVNGIRSELGNMAENSGSTIRTLANLGITTQKDGSLKIDDKKLDSVLATNFDDVGKFFAGDNGLMARMDKRISSYTGENGIISVRQKSLDATRTDVKEQRIKLEARATQIEARLFKQYYAMDALVGQLSTTGNQISQMLGNLPGVASKD